MLLIKMYKERDGSERAGDEARTYIWDQAQTLEI